MSYASEKRWENLWYFPTDLMKLYRKVPTNPAKVKAVQDRKVRGADEDRLRHPLLSGTVRGHRHHAGGLHLRRGLVQVPGADQRD